jgi:murein DD-endopeptidase MepM/ murein hydrolase activator NlpD
MAHKFSFIVLGGSGTTVKQINCSHKKLYVIMVLAGLVLAAACYAAGDYFSMRSQLAAKHQIERSLARQSEEVLYQREQIQRFAEKINALKEELVQLNQFEEQIRMVANIDHSNGQDGLFGVGGSAPDDLDPNIELTAQHKPLIKEMHHQISQLNRASTHQRTGFESLLEKLEAKRNLLAHTPAIRPVSGWVSSRFGYRRSPFTGKREFHKGLDIANHVGTPVVATANGIVTYSGKKGMLGNLVVIDHGHGLVTRYGHIGELKAEVGDAVERGQVIALMGNTGKSTGPHLHYEVRLNGLPVNPISYIQN